MRITAGTKLGAYEIVGPLGAGGMGEVYRARDSKLKREVAIKVLPDAFSSDADRVVRFQREAEVLASLNHPHIAAIYDVANSGPSRFLVLELVEGETLADRIARGPIPMNEALRIAKQIAEALEAAHERGIIHRDLKPANIKLRSEGNVKVLDFGLAKVRQAEDVQLSNAPTMVSVSTPGMILGTPAYMSPEQANGKDADRTSDVWAFGCVLYEMLTRRRAFAGETTNAILAGVLKDEPDWRALPHETPGVIRRLLRRCLQKGRKDRLQHIGDARIEIGEAQIDTLEARPVRNTSGRRERYVWISVLTVIVAGALVWTTRPVQPAPEVRVEVVTPPASDPASMAISPDGQKIVFEATSDGRSQLWLRALDLDSPPQPMPETAGARYPFWSPEGRSVGFFADSKLKRINIDGGSPRTVANAPLGLGGTWNRDDVILFAALPGSPILRVSASAAGGDTTPVTLASAYSQSFPHFLPDGRHFLYYDSGGIPGVYVGQLDGSQPKRLADSDRAPVYVSGYLLFGLQGVIYAQRFDPDRIVLSGNPFPIAGPMVVGLSASASGRIVYRTGSPSAGRRQLLWLDQSGRSVKEVGEALPWNAGSLEISPGDRSLALQMVKDGNLDVFTLDATQGGLRKLTDDAAADNFPVWSPRGDQIVFWSSRKKTGLYRRSATTGGSEELLLEVFGPPVDWSPNGDFILYRKYAANGSWDLLALPLDGDRKPLPVRETPDDERDGQFSPDQKWIAYQSNRSNRFEIYVQPFPGPANFTQVTVNGGAQVRWWRDGKGLFYIAMDGMLMSVPIKVSSDGKTVEQGTPTNLFPTHIGGALQGVQRQQYVVSHDGQRFLMNTAAEELNTSPIKVILNWKAKP